MPDQQSTPTLLSYLPRLPIQVLIIVGIACGIYAKTFFHGFNFDTPSILIYNPAVHGLSIKNILAVFGSVPNSVEYLPVRDLTYMLDYEL